MVESLVEMLQGGAVQSQIYAARSLANMADNALARERMLGAGTAEVTPPTTTTNTIIILTTSLGGKMFAHLEAPAKF